LLQQASQAYVLTYFCNLPYLQKQSQVQSFGKTHSLYPQSVSQYQSLTHLHYNSPSHPKYPETVHVSVQSSITRQHSSFLPVSPNFSNSLWLLSSYNNSSLFYNLWASSFCPAFS